MIERVLVASPRGFCAGVEMAIKALALMVRLYGAPVYCRNDIVHNRRVVEDFQKRGVIFVKQLDEVPLGAPVMFSAHGTAPHLVAEARNRGGVVVDAICPLVQKVHREVQTQKNGRIIYMGKPDHDESVNTMAIAPEAIWRVQTVEDVEALPGLTPDVPVAFLAQTTLPHSEWREVREAARRRFPWLWESAHTDLCYATTNRQEALLALIDRGAQAIIVVGSEESSNTKSLVKVGISAGVLSYRVDGANDLPETLPGVIGLTAGASAPDTAIEEVLDTLDPRREITEVVWIANEEQQFRLPPELSRLLTEKEQVAHESTDAMELVRSLPLRES